MDAVLAGVIGDAVAWAGLGIVEAKGLFALIAVFMVLLTSLWFSRSV